VNQPPMMTVSGIRGIVGESLTPELMAYIAYLQTKLFNGGAMVVARDTRPSGASLAQAVCKGIHAAGGECIDIGIAPTPTACVAVAHLRAAGGIIITASHNPTPYNGYKMIHASGRLCSGPECEKVYGAFRCQADKIAARTKTAAASSEPDRRVDAAAAHLERILAAVDVDCIRNAALSIAVDATNGAAAAVFPQLLQSLGVTWKGICTELTGNFTHNPEPRPEHLHELSGLLRAGSSYSGGFAFDPDGDRLVTMGEHGEPVSEELTLAFALQNVLAREKSDVATNLSTSMVIDDVARTFGTKVHRTRIGEANVVEGMRAFGCKIGGEGNGGVIYPKISTVRDGLTGIALILELMARSGKTITQLAAQIPFYCMMKEKISISGVDPGTMLNRLATAFSQETIDRQDGLKIIKADSWVHIRASNTEPILRCIAEARTEQQARTLIELVMKTAGA